MRHNRLRHYLAAYAQRVTAEARPMLGLRKSVRCLKPEGMYRFEHDGAQGEQGKSDCQKSDYRRSVPKQVHFAMTVLHGTSRGKARATERCLFVAS